MGNLCSASHPSRSVCSWPASMFSPPNPYLSGNKSWTANEELAREILMRNAPLLPDAVLPDVVITQSPYEALLEQTSPSEQLSVQGQALQQQPHLSACKASWWHEAQAVRARLFFLLFFYVVLFSLSFLLFNNELPSRYERSPSAEFSHLLACVSSEDCNPHQAQDWLNRAKAVAELQLRPLYMLTSDPREVCSYASAHFSIRLC